MSRTLAPSPSVFVTTRDPKGLKFLSIVENAYNKAGLDDEEAQRLNDTAGLSDLIANFIAEYRSPNQFADEETDSNYTYPAEYKGAKPLAEQITTLATMLDLDPSQALAYIEHLPEKPEGAEDWFAIPSPEAIGRVHFSEVTDPAARYCKALEFILEKIAASRKFYNYREEQLTSERLRTHLRTAEALATLAEAQPGNIWVVAAQLGMKHRGQSVRRARETFRSNEFGLTALAVCSIALVHPERLVHWEELDMDCAGDEFDDQGADVRFGRAPFLCFRGGRARFGARRFGYAREDYGSASFFLPQEQ